MLRKRTIELDRGMNRICGHAAPRQEALRRETGTGFSLGISKTLLSALVLSLGLVGLAIPAAAQVQWLTIDGNIHHEIIEGDIQYLPQTYEGPVDGMFIVTPINQNYVRITGGYEYETELGLSNSPWGPVFPPIPIVTYISSSVDLIARVVLLATGQPSYRNPRGTVETEVSGGVWGATFSTTETRRFPTFLLNATRSGTSWTFQQPLVLADDDQYLIEIDLGGTVGGLPSKP